MVRAADKVWVVPSRGGEPHPAIIIRISADGRHALVLSGTGTGPRDDIPHEVVDPKRRMGMALGLSKTTYFYQTAVHVRLVDELDVRGSRPIRCPLSLWEKLQKLA